MSYKDNPLEKMTSLRDALPEQDEEKMEKKSDVPLKLTHSSVIQLGNVSEKVTLRARLSKIKIVDGKQWIQAETADGKFFPVYNGDPHLPYVERDQHRQLITLTDVEVCQPEGTTDEHVYINGHIIDVFDDGAPWLPQDMTTKEHMNETQFGVLRLESVLTGKKANKRTKDGSMVECDVTCVMFSDSEGTKIRMLMWEPFLNDADSLCTGEDHFVVGASKLSYYRKERMWFVNYNASTIIQQVPDEDEKDDKDEKTACDGPAQPDKDENKSQK